MLKINPTHVVGPKSRAIAAAVQQAITVEGDSITLNITEFVSVLEERGYVVLQARPVK